MTLDKLLAIRGDLVQTDSSWENWTFDKLTKALRLGTWRNPVSIDQQDDRNQRDDRKREKPPLWAFNTHQAMCTATRESISPLTVLMLLLSMLYNRLCFNCTGPHKADNCRSKITCHKCKQKHHTSICDSSPRSEGLFFFCFCFFYKCMFIYIYSLQIQTVQTNTTTNQLTVQKIVTDNTDLRYFVKLITLAIQH